MRMTRGGAADQDALEQERRRQHQEGAEHVGIVEGAARAAIEHERVRQAAEQMKVGDDAGQRGDERGRQIAAQQMIEPRLRVRARYGGIEDRGDGEKDGDQHPGHRLALVGYLHDRDRIADVEQDQHQGERHQGAPQRQSGHADEDHAGQGDDLVGAGLDEDEGAGKAHEPEHEPAHGLGLHRQGAACAGPCGHSRGSGPAREAGGGGGPGMRHRMGRQYAFLALSTAMRRLGQDVEVEKDRPVLDVVEVVLDAALDLLLRVGLAAPAADLRPAGDPRLDPVAREIAVHGLVIEPVLGLGVDRVRARSHQRQIALHRHVDELRQFVDRGLAQEGADPGDARVALGHQHGSGGVALVDIHGAELVDLDQLVVEAVALLLEEHRAAAVELDGDRRQQHDRGCEQEQDAADEAVEQHLGHHVPVGDRLVEDVEHRDVADIGIGARPEAQLVRVRGQPDIDRQHPQLLEHLQDAPFRRDRQREDHQVDAGAAGELDQIVDRAELAAAGHGGGRTIVAAVVEQADDAHVVVALRQDGVDQALAALRRRRPRRSGGRAFPAWSNAAPAGTGRAGTRSGSRGRGRKSCRATRARIRRPPWRRTTC